MYSIIRFIGGLIVLLQISNSVSAQVSIKEAMSLMPYTSLPYPESYSYAEPIGIKNPGVVIPDKLYDDLQCRQYTSSDGDIDLAPALYLKIKLESSRFLLGGVTFGGATDYKTDVLIVTDADGNVTSSLESEIINLGIPIKQYKIIAGTKIIVYQLHVTSSQTINFEDFVGSGQSITAYRTDTTYSITDEGLFVVDSKKEYQPKNYTEKQLVGHNIWNL